MFQQQSFTHRGWRFTIEVDRWPSNEAANAAIIDLQTWVLEMDAPAAAALHSALEQEREHLVHESPYDRDAAPLPAVRDAQRRAVQTGLHGKTPGKHPPTISLEAWQATIAS